MPPRRQGKSLESTAKDKLAAEKRKPPRRSPAKKPKRLTAAQKVQRDNMLVRDRLVLDLSWTALAAKYEISERACRQIMAAWRSQNHASIDEIDAPGELWETLQGFEAQMERLRDAIVRARLAKNLNAEIGLEGKLLDVRKAKLALLQESELLPKNLGTLKHVFEVRTVVQKVVLVLDKIERGEIEATEAKREVLALIAPGPNSQN